MITEEEKVESSVPFHEELIDSLRDPLQAEDYLEETYEEYKIDKNFQIALKSVKNVLEAGNESVVINFLKWLEGVEDSEEELDNHVKLSDLIKSRIEVIGITSKN